MFAISNIWLFLIHDLDQILVSLDNATESNIPHLLKQ